MTRLFDAPLSEGRPPVSEMPEYTQQVAAWPGWVWWHGVNGQLYARRKLTSPPKVVRAHNFTVLLERIRAAEKRD